MGAPPAQLAQLTLLREVVGPGPSDDLLTAAWQRSGGDLAAAVNIVLDAPPPARNASRVGSGSLSQPLAPRHNVQSSEAHVVATVSLDDSDEEEEGCGSRNVAESASSTAASGAARLLSPAPSPAPAPVASQASALPTPAKAGHRRKWRHLPGTEGASAPASVTVGKQAELAGQREQKRPRLEAPSAANSKCAPPPPVATANPIAQRGAARRDFVFALGTAEVRAYSTIRLSAEQQFQSDSGMGSLLRPGARLDLRWNTDTKKAKFGRPGSSDPSSGRESGSIRFDAEGKEVGKFPSSAARTLIPLLSRNLAEVEAYVGHEPPLGLDLGTTVPVKIVISLRSTALRLPGQVGNGVERSQPAGERSSASSGSAGSATAKAKAKGQKAVLKEEADREILRSATAQLLELLRLPCRRTAAEPAGLTGGNESGDIANGSGGTAAADAEGQADEDGDEAEEMTREVAAQLGGREALERHDLPGVALPVTLFKARLRWYQAQAVYWMWHRENPTSEMPEGWLDRGASLSSTSKVASQAQKEEATEGDSEVLRPLHPMWDEYVLPETVESAGKNGGARFLYHHRTTGAVSLDFPDAALAHCRGGILADDMGLGKTVMCLALLSLDVAGSEVPSARKAAPELRSLEEDSTATPRHLSAFFQSGADDGVGGVLVVAPVSLISQWHAEIEKHFPSEHRPSVHEYHGAGRHKTAEQLRMFGVVLTTYGTLSAERQDAPLFQVYWRRIILDEAHTIKNRCSRIAQAAFHLRSFCRWCVTGTPLQNCIDELYALVRFLRVDPWSTWSAWRKAVTLPLERGRHGDTKSFTEALEAARHIVQRLLLRRTKTTTDPRTGELLLKLPPKHVHVLELDLSEAERDFYDALYRRAKAQFDTFVSRGQALTMYTHILQLILKLRQALCHPFLVFARGAVQDQGIDSLEKQFLEKMAGQDDLSEKYLEGVLKDLRSGDLPECPICCDTPEDPAMTPCGHIFCRECAIQALKKCNSDCPLCQRKGALESRSLKVLPGASRFPAHLLAKASCSGNGGLKPDTSSPDGAMHSTKMRELLRYLHEDMAASRRSVIFSQWTSFLDLVGSALEAASIPCQRFDGSLSREVRAERVAWLGEPAGPTAPHGGGRALLCSLKAGGVGLNLVAATRLYLLDLWWNPAMEEQAIQRVHRIGQTSEVEVYKFVIRDSIDGDLLQLQRAKAHLLEDAIQGGVQTEAAAKLTLDDLKRLFNPCRSIQNLRNNAGPNGNVEQTPSASAASNPASGATKAVSASSASSAWQPPMPSSATTEPVPVSSDVLAPKPVPVQMAAFSGMDSNSNAQQPPEASNASTPPVPVAGHMARGRASSCSAQQFLMASPSASVVPTPICEEAVRASCVDGASNPQQPLEAELPAQPQTASVFAHTALPPTAVAEGAGRLLNGLGAAGFEDDLLDLMDMKSRSDKPAPALAGPEDLLLDTPDWDAGGLCSPNRDAGGEPKGDLSDSDILAARDAFEEQTACWAAMSMDDDVA